MTMKRIAHYLLFASFLVAPLVSQEPAGGGSRLLIVISVDQMKSEYYDWYGKNWNGGLERLFKEGVVYTNAILDYASSETGPGHATLSTGCFPRTHGILGNSWIDPVTRRDVYCVEDSTALTVAGEGGSRSPKNLAVPALGDWLKAASKRSKVVSISIKDRAAILMGGKKPDQVYWYNSKTGHLVTSTYYTREPHAWVAAFNAANWTQKNVPPVWNKLLPEDTYQGPDDQQGEFMWGGTRVFPRTFAMAERSSQMVTSPWGDMFLLDAARAAVKEEKLGTRGTTDLLFIGLSSTDYVGHSFGPNSHEMQDHLARLDASLGAFIADMEAALGASKLLIALSADHACLPLPEYTVDVDHKPARRLNVRTEVLPKVHMLDSLLRLEWGIEADLIDHSGFLNYAAAEKKGISRDLLEERVREGYVAIDGVADIYFKRELTGETMISRPYADRFMRSYYKDRGEDFQIRYDENVLPSSRETGTSHGSTYDYDNKIPLVFWGVPSRVNRVNTRAVLADLSPTLAAILDIAAPPHVEGVPLSDALSR